MKCKQLLFTFLNIKIMKNVKRLIQLFLLTISLLWTSCSKEDVNASGDCQSQRVYVHQLITARNTVSGREVVRYFDVRTQSDKLMYLMEIDSRGNDIRRYDSGNSITSGLSYACDMKQVMDQVFGSDGRYEYKQVLRPVATFKYCGWSVTIRS
jgi:hypothetical protein